MALFPQGLTQVDARCNPGERRVLHQLKRCLEDDYLVWHDLPLGPRARQPDFVILSPRWGVLILEVKHWRLSTLLQANRDRVLLDVGGESRGEMHPLRQAREYMIEVVHLLQDDPTLVHASGPFNGKLLFPYGHGAVFSNIWRKDVAGTDFGDVFPEHQTLLRDDLDDDLPADEFQKRLWGLFTVHYPHTLSLPQRDRIRWHLFPELRVREQLKLDFTDTGNAPVALPDLLAVMDLQQEQIARSMGEGHRVIHGAAGSGKTMILVYRAQHLLPAARPDRPILVLCFNRALADRIDAQLRQRGCDERVQVRTFHSWCKDMVNTYQLAMPAVRGDDYYVALADTVARAIATQRVPAGQYTALMVDEAHDFEAAWLRMASQMVDPQTRSLLVLYDDAQSIYQKQRRRFSLQSVGIEARGRTSILKLNYRNTHEILMLALQCAQSLLVRSAGDELVDSDAEALPLVQPSSAGRHGPAPVLIEAASAQEEAALIAARIAALHAEGLALDHMAVLARTKHLLAPIEAALRRQGLACQSMSDTAFRRFDWHRPSIKLLTMHSAKGLEFAQIFVVGLQALPWKDESPTDAIRLLYVAMTRATQALVLSACARSAVVDRVRAALRASP